MPGFGGKKKKTKEKVVRVIEEEQVFKPVEKVEQVIDMNDINIPSFINKSIIDTKENGVDTFVVNLLKVSDVVSDIVPYIIGNTPDDSLKLLIEESTRSSERPSDFI